MPCHAEHKPAFRCKSCGHLEHAAHAGENAHPHACSVCGEGVRFSPRGIKSAVPDNWEVLADCEPARLGELGLCPDSVGRHDKTGTAPAGNHVHVTAHDGPGTRDAA